MYYSNKFIGLFSDSVLTSFCNCDCVYCAVRTRYTIHASSPANAEMAVMISSRNFKLPAHFSPICVSAPTIKFPNGGV